jgi:hypothetical protein
MYSFQPFLSVTPIAGPRISYDLAAIDRMVLARWIPEPEFVQKVTIRRRIRNIKYGWRLRINFAWLVDPGSASEDTLQAIAYHMNRNGELFEITMAATAYPIAYRPVELADWKVSNLEDKNILGFYQAEFATVNLLSEDALPPEFAESPPGIAGWIADPT